MIDLVAGGEHERRGAPRQGGVGEAVGNEVQRLCGIAGEHRLGRRTTDETRDAGTRGFEGVRGLLGQLVGPAVDGGIVLLVELPLGVEHGARFLGGRSRVQVDQSAAAAHAALKDREILAQGGSVDHPATPAPVNCS